MSLRASIPFRVQRAVIKFTPFAAGVVAVGCCCGQFFVLQDRPIFGAVLGVAWSGGAAFGSRSRSFGRRLRGLAPRDGGPSWDEALLFGIITYVIACIVFRIDLLRLGIPVLGCAINFVYATMKVRCWVNRCCEGNREYSAALTWIKTRGGLPLWESMLSLIFGLLATAALVGSLNELSIAIGWFGHAGIRWVDRYLRFPHKSLYSLFDWQSGGLAGFALVFIGFGEFH